MQWVDINFFVLLPTQNRKWDLKCANFLPMYFSQKLIKTQTKWEWLFRKYVTEKILYFSNWMLVYSNGYIFVAGLTGKKAVVR